MTPLVEANYYSHCLMSPHRSQGKLSTTVALPTLKFHVAANFLFRDASCSILKRQKNISDLREATCCAQQFRTGRSSSLQSIVSEIGTRLLQLLSGVQRRNEKKSSLVPVEFVAYRGSRACVLCMVVPVQEPEKSADKFRKMRTVRTELSKVLQDNVQSRTSMVREFASAISHDLRGLLKRNFSWLSLLGSIREQLAAGWRMTMSRRPTHSASSSAKSCGDTTSAIKPRRRPF